MRFIDANVISYAFYQNLYQASCQKILHDGGLTNTVSIIEAFNIIEFETSRDLASRAVRALLKSHITIIDVDVNMVFETLKRSDKYKKLKFIDLLHYTTTLVHTCSSIVSFDADFDGLEIPRQEA